jgi:hypothetical protein
MDHICGSSSRVYTRSMRKSITNLITINQKFKPFRISIVKYAMRFMDLCRVPGSVEVIKSNFFMSMVELRKEAWYLDDIYFCREQFPSISKCFSISIITVIFICFNSVIQ